MSDDTPQILGNAGLTGRQPLSGPGARVEVEPEEPMEPVVQKVAPGVMPPNCLRVAQSPRAVSCLEEGGSGFGPCVGLQEDGGCLLDVVRRARMQGVEPEFEVRWDEWGNQSWRYTGAPLA